MADKKKQQLGFDDYNNLQIGETAMWQGREIKKAGDLTFVEMSKKNMRKRVPTSFGWVWEAV